MADEPKTQSWWQTLPGIFTAIAAIITALAGLVAALYQAGLFQRTRPEPTAAAGSPASPSASGVLPASPAAPSPKLPAIAPYLNIPAAAAPTLPAKSINLLPPDAGGHVIAASGDDWVGTVDGKEEFNQISDGVGAQSDAVFAFRDERPAVIERFTMFIPGTGERNVRQFELFVGNDSPTGPFESIGKFQTQNVKLFKTPYQEFRFTPVKARYLKVKLLSSYGSPNPVVMEIQLFGQLQKS